MQFRSFRLFPFWKVWRQTVLLWKRHLIPCYNRIIGNQKAGNYLHILQNKTGFTGNNFPPKKRFTCHLFPWSVLSSPVGHLSLGTRLGIGWLSIVSGGGGVAWLSLHKIDNGAVFVEWCSTSALLHWSLDLIRTRARTCPARSSLHFSSLLRKRSFSWLQGEGSQRSLSRQGRVRYMWRPLNPVNTFRRLFTV